MRWKFFLLSLLSAVLLTAAWPQWGFAPLLLVAFIPLLIVQHTIQNDNRLRARHLFLYAYITFLLWNILTTWWIWNSTEGGAVLAIGANALLMALVFLVFHKIKRLLPERIATFSLIPLWIAFEHFHLDWDLSWPWLTLGNGFAGFYKWVQWYEYTGVFGGSLWILLLNVLLFDLWIHRNTFLRSGKMKTVYIAAVIVLIVVPVTCSLVRYYTFDLNANTVKPLNVVIVQPNIDPYGKFSGDFQPQVEQMIAQTDSLCDSTTDYLVFPETALTEPIWENNFNGCWSIPRLRDFLLHYPKLKIVTGASSGYIYGSGLPHPVTARKFSFNNDYFDDFNAALQIDTSLTVQSYHKSKLVPGVEQMPFPKYFHFLEKFAINLGGTSGTLAKQADRTVFKSPDGLGKIAPVICYESIYGDYVGQYIRNGAEYIFIITNDGWWGDTPGYRQHLLYGGLRAIETRKSIARAANTGISCFYNQRGDIFQPQPWWEKRAIKQKIVSTAGETFYTRHGDYIAVIMNWLLPFIFAGAVVRYVRKRMKRG